MLRGDDDGAPFGSGRNSERMGWRLERRRHRRCAVAAVSRGWSVRSTTDTAAASAASSACGEEESSSEAVSCCLLADRFSMT